MSLSEPVVGRRERQTQFGHHGAQAGRIVGDDAVGAGRNVPHIVSGSLIVQGITLSPNACAR